MTADEEIANLRAENAHLREENARLLALLPPTPGPGQRWRQGTKVPEHVYVHTDGHPAGFPVGRMPSVAIAALLCEAANAHLARKYGGEEVASGDS